MTIACQLTTTLHVFQVNIVIIVRVLTVMVNLRSDPLKKQKYTKMRAALKGVIILLPLLGLTWLFGLISVNSETIVFQYLFAILNSLQGAFIFIFNYALNKEVRSSFRRTLQRTTTTSL
ncbi:adhesion G-protein coupled receptor D1-like [Exaiptasia diaphana]|uniref:G-protein coupled receptors family 2 profile 2 domain-containing protein n=1 Tax=Exaiptasia diaphana TaxID=2652724 RepID=A0A913YTA8_EXADI|nr:adhesion G-protein coupled receptor D1-like [Exaiptasia diaphana]